MTLKERFGHNLSEARHCAGLTQAQLGERVSLAQGHISRLETGFWSPRLGTLVKLADALGVSATDLLDGIE